MPRRNVGNRAKLLSVPRLVMAGQQPVEDGRTRPYVPAIPMIWHCAILIEIAGTSLDKPGDDALSFARVTHVGGNCFSLNAFRLMVCSRIARRFRGATFTLNFRA